MLEIVDDRFCDNSRERIDATTLANDSKNRGACAEPFSACAPRRKRLRTGGDNWLNEVTPV
jgi:hypothetical protein